MVLENPVKKGTLLFAQGGFCVMHLVLAYLREIKNTFFLKNNIVYFMCMIYCA